MRPFPGFQNGCVGCSTGHICGNISGIATQSLSELEFEKGVWGAALRGNLEKVQECSYRTHILAPDNYGFSPLLYAATEGHYDICDYLLKKGANPNIQTNNSWATALHRACFRGHLKVVILLINNGANPEIKDADGNTALHKACSNEKREVINYLIENYPILKEIPNNKGSTPNWI